jgi:transposase InsO family protein
MSYDTRADRHADYIATAVQEWLAKIGVKTLYIAPGSPWENGYNESFNARFATSCSTARSTTASPRQRC